MEIFSGFNGFFPAAADQAVPGGAGDDAASGFDKMVSSLIKGQDSDAADDAAADAQAEADAGTALQPGQEPKPKKARDKDVAPDSMAAFMAEVQAMQANKAARMDFLQALAGSNDALHLPQMPDMPVMPGDKGKPAPIFPQDLQAETIAAADEGFALPEDLQEIAGQEDGFDHEAQYFSKLIDKKLQEYNAGRPVHVKVSGEKADAGMQSPKPLAELDTLIQMAADTGKAEKGGKADTGADQAPDIKVIRAPITIKNIIGGKTADSRPVAPLMSRVDDPARDMGFEAEDLPADSVDADADGRANFAGHRLVLPDKPVLSESAQLDKPAPTAAASVRESAVQQVKVVVSKLSPSMNKITIKLHPEELGKVEVELVFKGNQMTAKLTAEKRETLEMLRQDSQSLREALTASGVRTNQAEFSFSLRGAQQQADDGHGQNQNQHGRQQNQHRQPQRGDADFMAAMADAFDRPNVNIQA
ncbi:MAG: flagellar hook-length control protein FliK [Alphaproteobacteria bacterium]|nr:flagellar hook-length control protein FliK [Alphaproteobacteria bacterium]